MAGGRQREFDKQQALSAAMHVFWQKGYVGASLADLTSAMGINKPSMYAAFGNKEQLFVQATEHYMAVHAEPLFPLLHTPNQSLKQRVGAYMRAVVAAQCAGETPLGCFVSLCINEAASQSMPQSAVTLIEQAKGYAENYLTQLFKEEITAGNLSPQAQPATLASLLVTLMHGTAAMARGGKRFEELEPLLEITLQQVISGSNS